MLDPAGHVVGEGYHVRKGEAHAEMHALQAAGERAQGGTAIVTLEPCNHWGRTPPCRALLLEAGIERVVIGILDPTSRDGGGARALLEAGVDVEVEVLIDEVLLVLGPWFQSVRTRRPFVTWAYAVAPDRTPSALDTALFLSPPARVDAEILRDTIDAVIQPAPAAPDPAALLADLDEQGIRTVLLSTSPEGAQRFLAAGLVDRIVVYQSVPPPSSSPSSPRGLILPQGFAVDDVTRLGGDVRVRGRPCDAR